MPSNHKVMAFVMAGGEGSRLHPLTASRCKPAVPLVPPQERIGFDAQEDRQRFVVTESGIVVVPSGFFPPRGSVTPFLSLEDPAELSAEGVPRIEVVT